MCPDKTIISVYVDGELPGLFKEQLELHLKHCEACAGKAAAYTALSEKLSADAGGTECVESTKERIWAKLEAAQVRSGYSGAASRRRYGFWRRDLRLPLPVAAAAAMIIAAAFIVQNSRISLLQQTPREIPVAAVENEDTLISISEDQFYPADQLEMINASNSMHEVLRFLEDDGDSNILIIKLPESKNFNRYSEPRLINASDYSGRNGGR
ncbi:MAG: zf-HC2 domain-containing protein [Spirochaetaceae bacterium]|jgi:hypothetical protein|nr:zf-HC2 domain-containing protein [Spirochaetaceae bacterium]